MVPWTYPWPSEPTGVEAVTTQEKNANRAAHPIYKPDGSGGAYTLNHTTTGATGELTPAPYRVGDWVHWKKSGLNREGRGQVLTCEADQDAWVLTVTGLELELLPSDIVNPPAEPQGVKHDTKKPRWTLVPWASVSAIVEVLEYGAQKYAPDNWRKVENGRERYANAALRHIMAWLGGERCDPESGLPHLAHAGCCILFLLDVDRVNKP